MIDRSCLKPNLISWEPTTGHKFLGRVRSVDPLGDRHNRDQCHAEAFSATFRIPCGHCLHCRIKRAQEWKIRGVHEASTTLHQTMAVTLTYADEHLPEGGTLSAYDLRTFLKRVRSKYGEVRVLGCGEYGPNTGRAHYHLVIFGLVLPDLYKSGKHWASPALQKLWGKGNITLHPATPASIGYVSGYVVKKLRQPRGTLALMETVDTVTGSVTAEYEVEAEFLTASRRPAVGLKWLEQNHADLIRDGYLILNEKPCHVVPSYYLKKLSEWKPPGYDLFLEKRQLVGEAKRVTWPEDWAIQERVTQAALDKRGGRESF